MNVMYQIVEENPLNNNHFIKKEILDQNIPLNYIVVDLENY